MVLSLVDLSLRSITKGIEDGTIQHPHLLPPKLRKWVLDTAIKQGLANNPNVLALLTSVEFLNGMTSLTAEVRTDYDLIFLERLTESLATKLPNGDTVGANIRKLNLKVRGWCIWNQDPRSNLSAVSDLIAHCPNTTSLDFVVTESSVMKGFWPLKNLNSSCNRVMGNLGELSLCNFNWITNLDSPIVNFSQLTTLKLNNCFMKDDQWSEVFENIQSVENLHLSNIAIGNKKGLDCILLFPLPHLKSLEVVGDGFTSNFACNNAFVDNLMECPKLRQVHLKLDEKSTDEESLVRLASMDIALKMEVRIVMLGKDPAETAAVLDSSSRFKIVHIFREWMDSFEMSVMDEWDSQYTTALEDVLSKCPKLTSFGIVQPRFDVSQPQRQRTSIEARKRFNAALVRFFSDVERAQQLNRLILYGNFDETVLSTVFESCPNLVLLDIRICPNLRDQHLIDWVSLGGGKLTDLVVDRCKNVTSEGIIPILTKCAEGLLGCVCIALGQGNGGRNLETELRNRCPNAHFENIP